MAPSSETLLSILTTERWTHNGVTSFIIFRPNKTGHILFGADLVPFFARGFDWKALNTPVLEHIASIPTSNKTHTLAHLSLEIKITDRDPLPEYYPKGMEGRTSYDDLTEEGLQPKTYTVRLESGRFPMPYLMDLYGKEDFEGMGGNRLRLVFHKSPYRPKEEWKGNRSTLDSMKRDPTIFVARPIDENLWDSCLVI